MIKLFVLAFVILPGLSAPGLASSSESEYQKEIDTHQEEKDRAYWQAKEGHYKPDAEQAKDDHTYRFGDNDPEYENRTQTRPQQEK